MASQVTAAQRREEAKAEADLDRCVGMSATRARRSAESCGSSSEWGELRSVSSAGVRRTRLPAFSEGPLPPVPGHRQTWDWLDY